MEYFEIPKTTSDQLIVESFKLETLKPLVDFLKEWFDKSSSYEWVIPIPPLGTEGPASTQNEQFAKEQKEQIVQLLKNIEY